MNHVINIFLSIISKEFSSFCINQILNRDLVNFQTNYSLTNSEIEKYILQEFHNSTLSLLKFTHIPAYLLYYSRSTNLPQIVILIKNI